MRNSTLSAAILLAGILRLALLLLLLFPLPDGVFVRCCASAIVVDEQVQEGFGCR